MINLLEKYPILSIILFVILMLGFTIDVPPVSIMEARNFITAREMLSDNNWILTSMNGLPRYEKPPLPTWITALFGYLFGMGNVLALRWPALLMLSCIGLYSYLLSLELQLKKAEGLIIGFISVTSFYVIAIIIEAPWDIYAHGFMLIALYHLFKILNEGKITLKNGALFVLLLACSILSKGPVSLYVLLLSFLIAFGVVYGYRYQTVVFLKVLGLIAIGLIIGGLWYYYVRHADPESFNRIASRETSNWSSYNVRPFYYYWSFFVQSGIWALLALTGLFYPFMIRKVEHVKAYKFGFFWTIVAVILLSIIPEKKSRYLMPVLIPLAYNIGFYIIYLLKSAKNSSTKQRVPAYITFGIVTLASCLFWVAAFFVDFNVNTTGIIRMIISAIAFLILGIYMLIQLKKWDVKKLFYGTVLFMALIGFLGLPLFQSPADYEQGLSELQEMKEPLYFYGYVAPEVIYAYGDKIPSVQSDGILQIPKEDVFLIITNNNDLNTEPELTEGFSIERLNDLDLNAFKEGQRNYRKRLVNKVFRLSKIESSSE